VDTLIPHNLDAEAAVLAAIMLDNSTLDKIALKDAFYSSDNASIYEMMLELGKEGKPIDLITLTEKLPGMAYYISGLETPSAVGAEHYADIVKEKYVRREIIKVAIELQESAISGDIDISKTLREIEVLQGGVVIEEFSTALTDAAKRYDENITKGVVAGIPTGIADLDSLTGGYGKEEMVVIAARPSMGKTSLALQIARHVAKKKRVGVVSLETSGSGIVDRIVFQYAELSYKDYRTGGMGKELIGKLYDACADLEKLNLYINHSSKIQEISAWARRNEFDLLVIDYLQLVRGGEGKSVYDITSDISHRVKEITRHCPVIILSQLSRLPEGRGGNEPQMSDLRNSGVIEEDADQIWMLFRPEYYKINEFKSGGSTENVAQLFVRKNRNGETGEIRLYFDKPSMGFKSYVSDLPR
jgi:replicative DNA helicase